tara:strand:+ start:923 stop:1072 length:150 start_codon:yes stop_codon:yes gene_type:complete
MTKVTIPITDEQMKNIQEIMKKHSCSQDEAVRFLMVAGMREMKLRKDWV